MRMNLRLAATHCMDKFQISLLLISSLYRIGRVMMLFLLPLSSLKIKNRLKMISRLRAFA
jgi:hypothetical protein